MPEFKPAKGAHEKLAETAEYKAGMSKIAGDVARQIRGQAPARSGYYRRSIKTFTQGDTIGVASSDPFAHLVEYGSVKNPAYAPIRRGVRAAGLRLVESPKQ